MSLPAAIYHDTGFTYRATSAGHAEISSLFSFFRPVPAGTGVAFSLSSRNVFLANVPVRLLEYS